MVVAQGQEDSRGPGLAGAVAQVWTARAGMLPARQRELPVPTAECSEGTLQTRDWWAALVVGMEFPVHLGPGMGTRFVAVPEAVPEAENPMQMASLTESSAEPAGTW